MQVSKHRKHTDYIILIILGILTAVALFGYALWGWLEKRENSLPGVRTTYSTNVDATLICYTLFERLGIKPQRSLEIIQSNSLGDVGVVFLMNPIIPLKKLETKALKKWVENGGVLVTTCLMSALHETFDLIKIGHDCGRDNDAHFKKCPPKKGRRSYITTKADAHDHPLDRDILRVLFSSSAVIEVKEPESGDYKVELDDLFQDTTGLRIAGLNIGKGCVILISDSSFLTNDKIGKGDNAILAVNLVSWALTRATSSDVVFDEYHFGFGRHETGFDVMGTMLFTTPAGWAVLSVTIAGLLFMIYRGRKFGPRRGLNIEQRRSSLEFVYAAGSTYRSSDANRLTLEIIYKWLKEKAIRSVGLPSTASNALIDQLFFNRSGKEPGTYKAIMDECDNLLSQKWISERQLSMALRKLGLIDSEVMYEGRDS